MDSELNNIIEQINLEPELDEKLLVKLEEIIDQQLTKTSKKYFKRLEK